MDPKQQQQHCDEAVTAGGERAGAHQMSGAEGEGAAWGPVEPGKVSVRLRVRAQVDFGLGLFVVGSCPQLGSWRSRLAIPMMQVAFGGDYWNNEDDADTWSVWECQTSLPRNSLVDYRYFVGQLVNQMSSTDQSRDRDMDLEVLLWETNIQPRHLKTADSDVDEMQVPLAEFGNYDGTRTTSTGWLESHACIQIRLHSNAIFMLKPKHRLQRYSVKCSPIDYEPVLLTEDDQGNDESSEIFTESSMDGPPTCTKTAVLYYNLSKLSREMVSEDLRPKPQPNKGCMYKSDDYLVFVARGINQNHLGFQLDFMVNAHKAQPQLVGSAHLLPPKKELSVFSKRIPIIGLHHRPIGEVQVEVLRVSPLPHYESLMDVSFQNHWKWRSNGTTLNVGHRGMGSSYKRVTSAKENTICSLHSAAGHGADFVELDVLLSKDKMPVIYHDFDVCLFTPSKNKRVDGGRLVQVAIKDLTVEQLHSLKIFHSESSSDPIEITESKPDDQEDDNDEQPFPSLYECLEKVDPHVGFNIEIKYPQDMESGDREQENFFDMNFFLDTILTVVLKHAGDRKIIFSSFHADVCIMVGLKQNKYPVLLLSQGRTERYQPYKDWRAAYFQNSINFAKAEGMLGVDLHAEGVLKDLSLVPYIQSLGLVLFVWGDDLNEDHAKDTFRRLNVDAIIFDRIGQNQPDQFTLTKETPSLEEMLSKAPEVPSPSPSTTNSREHRDSDLHPIHNPSHYMPSNSQSVNNSYSPNDDTNPHSNTTTTTAMITTTPATTSWPVNNVQPMAVDSLSSSEVDPPVDSAV